MPKYSQFILMIATSTAVMFGLMYLNTYQMNHLFFSEKRLYMGAAMAVIMLLLMLNMYTSTVKSSAILVTAVIVFTGALWLVRSQSTVEDVSWMKAMIAPFDRPTDQ